MSAMKLAGHRFQQADYSIPRYAATVPGETTIEDVCHPEFFQNHLSVLRPGMEIKVLSDDMALDADLRVMTVTKTTASVRVLRLFSSEAVPQPDLDVDLDDDVVVNFGGPKHKWRYVHAGTVIEFGFGSQDEAERAAKAYVLRLSNPS